MRLPLIIGLLFLLFGPRVWGFALPTHNPVPGGVAVIDIGTGQGKPQGYFNKRKVLTAQVGDRWYAVVGIGLKVKPGKHQIVAAWPKADNQKHSFSVTSKDYPAQYLTIKNKRKVDPNKEDIKRIQSESGRKRKARNTWSTKISAQQAFIRPTSGIESSQFGLRRFFNKKPRRPHMGLDIAAPEGQPIVAPAAGKVVEAGNFFFSGNVIFLDHGQGLVTLYAHMNKLDVSVGQQVKQGEKIGEVGQTGRVTGAHLHWSVLLNGQYVDPKLFSPTPKP